MRKTMGIGLVLVAVLLFAPLQASACKSCLNPGFWDPNCAHSGCTYCAACSICCGGNPGAGGNCALYCGGPALASTVSTDPTPSFFLDSADTSDASTLLPPAQCSSASR